MSDEQHDTTAESARLIIDVVAGVIPQTPMHEHTRRYAITSSQWEEAEQQGKTGRLLAETNGKAQGYAALLMLQPDALNWVRTDWVWF